jgi:acetyl-CoA C-acetyltransferase
MPEAVIVSTARSPIGRAYKGSLKDIRPDDLAVQVIRSAVDAVGLTGDQIDDVAVGCAEPHDEHGGNLARRIAVQLGWDTTPATTVNRFCASSTQTARMAFHAIKAGEGDVFVSAGVECVSRYRNFGSAGVDDPGSQNPLFAEAQQRTARYAETNETWHDPRADGQVPDIYITMGQTAEHVATRYGISRADQDAFGVRSQISPRSRSRTASSAARSPHPAAGRYDRDHRRRAAAGHHAGEGQPVAAGLPPRRHGHGRQLLPAERRRRRRGDHE